MKTIFFKIAAICIYSISCHAEAQGLSVEEIIKSVKPQSVSVSKLVNIRGELPTQLIMYAISDSCAIVILATVVEEGKSSEAVGPCRFYKIKGQIQNKEVKWEQLVGYSDKDFLSKSD